MNEAKPDPVMHLDATPWRPGEWAEIRGNWYQMTSTPGLYVIPIPEWITGGLYLTRERIEDAVGCGAAGWCPWVSGPTTNRRTDDGKLQGREEGRREGQVTDDTKRPNNDGGR